MDHRSEAMCDVDCKAGERNPISDPAEESIATPVQSSLDIRESAQSRCVFSEQEMFTGNVASVGETVSAVPYKSVGNSVCLALVRTNL